MSISSVTVRPNSSAARIPGSFSGSPAANPAPEFSGWLNPDPLVNVQTRHGVRQMRLSEAQRLSGGGGGNGGDDGWWERLKAGIKRWLGF